MQRAQNADLKILLFDGTQETPDAHTLSLADENSLIVINKSDCKTNFVIPNECEGSHTTEGDFSVATLLRNDMIEISAKTGTGLDTLEQSLIAKIETLLGSRETPSLTRRRHREALEEASESLARAQNAPLPELIAEDLRLAVRALGRITGRIDVEDLLDVIFKDFCIGK